MSLNGDERCAKPAPSIGTVFGLMEAGFFEFGSSQGTFIRVVELGSEKSVTKRRWLFEIVSANTRLCPSVECSKGRVVKWWKSPTAKELVRGFVVSERLKYDLDVDQMFSIDASGELVPDSQAVLLVI
jgi:hypothetical protein